MVSQIQDEEESKENHKALKASQKRDKIALEKLQEILR